MDASHMEGSEHAAPDGGPKMPQLSHACERRVSPSLVQLLYSFPGSGIFLGKSDAPFAMVYL